MGSKLIYGVGINDMEDQSRTKAYKTWFNMIRRCYDPKWHLKQPTYIGCSVSPVWHTFSNFKGWFDKHCVEGWALDKDMLEPDNKEYSAFKCVFVPQALNNLFSDSYAARKGLLPVGVYKNKQGTKYITNIRLKGKNKYLGSFDTVIEASEAYQQAKKQHVLSECARYRELYSDNAPLMNLIGVIENRYQQQEEQPLKEAA